MDDSICPEGDRGVIMCAMWSLWQSRNDRRHDKTPIDPGAAMDRALEACCQVWGSKQRDVGRASMSNMHWRPPEVGSLKINVDGAYLRESNTGAMGAMLRDSNVIFMAASAHWMDSLGSALLAEVEAFRDGVRLIPRGTMEHYLSRD